MKTKTKTETMKDLTKYYIDLKKCTEEEQEHIISLLPKPENSMQYRLFWKFKYLHFSSDLKKWIVQSDADNKTELTHPEFIKLFEGGDEVRTELLPDVAYWRHRCLLAEKYLSVSPCDPDITEEQIKAHKDYNQYLETFGNKD